MSRRTSASQVTRHLDAADTANADRPYVGKFSNGDHYNYRFVDCIPDATPAQVAAARVTVRVAARRLGFAPEEMFDALGIIGGTP